MLINISGQMGSGKTLLMSILGLYLSKYFNCGLYSNYALVGSKKISSLSDLFNIKSGIILFDELWLNLDARLWKNNVFLTRWINQTRKKDLLIFYTTQHFLQVDIRVRRATDLIIWCFKYPDRFLYVFINPLLNKVIKLFYLPVDKAKLFYNCYNSFEFIKPLY